MEMENEVMQFQTIILMLMRIERVNVEMILEWLERYANIFKEPISKCVNNYEAGAWEALEQLKEDISYQDMIRIVESLQAAVEKIPISPNTNPIKISNHFKYSPFMVCNFPYILSASVANVSSVAPSLYFDLFIAFNISF